MRVSGIEKQTTDAWLVYQNFKPKPTTVPGLVSCFCQNLYKTHKN